MSDEGSYAPQSPDLSAYHSAQIISTQPPAYRYPQQQFAPQSHNQSTAYQPSPASATFAPHNNQHYVQSPNTFSPNAMPRRPRAETDVEDEWAPGSSTPARGGRNSKKQKIEEDVGKPAPGSVEGIEVKTKFPVARIKRIMQADEDVGKVAQVTPTAVSKALELFMISLVTKAASQARSKSAKKVTAAHLKQVIESDVQFDFLGDIIAKVPDAPAPKKDEDSEGTGEGKKKRAAPRRKKKEDDDF